jgi:hypothetical protein
MAEKLKNFFIKTIDKIKEKKPLFFLVWDIPEARRRMRAYKNITGQELTMKKFLNLYADSDAYNKLQNNQKAKINTEITP